MQLNSFLMLSLTLAATYLSILAHYNQQVAFEMQIKFHLSRALVSFLYRSGSEIVVRCERISQKASETSNATVVTVVASVLCAVFAKKTKRSNELCWRRL